MNLPIVQSLGMSALPTRHTVVLVKTIVLILFKFVLCNIWRGVGSGLSPDPRFYAFVYDYDHHEMGARGFKCITQGFTR
jgi:hypothetical protein